MIHEVHEVSRISKNTIFIIIFIIIEEQGNISKPLDHCSDFATSLLGLRGLLNSCGLLGGHVEKIP